MEQAPLAVVVPQPSRLWQALRDSIGGKQYDYTQGSLARAIVLLAVPMVVEMSFEALFAVVDSYFVAKLGPDAMATVGLTESVLAVLYAVGMGLAVAGTATVARRIGEGNPAAASRTTAQALWVTLVAAVVLGLLGGLGARTLLRVLGGSAGVLSQGGPFTTVMLGGSGVILLLFVLNGVLRGAGDATSAMKVLLLANVINIVLDPCLIQGLGPFPKLGLTGAAVATTIGRGTGVVYQLFLLTRGKGRVALRRENARPEGALMWQLFILSLGGMGQMLLSNASWTVLARVMSPFGSEALAGYFIAIRIVVFAILPAWGVSNAASTLVGQNLGAGKPERAEAAVWRTGWINVAFLSVVAVVFHLFAERLVGFFTDDPTVAPYGVQCLHILSYGYPFFAYGMVMMQSFNGAGDTLTPTVLNVICFWLIQTPAAWLLANAAGWGPRGIFAAIAFSQAMSAVLGVLAFRRGRWKTRRV